MAWGLFYYYYAIVQVVGPTSTRQSPEIYQVLQLGFGIWENHYLQITKDNSKV